MKQLALLFVFVSTFAMGAAHAQSCCASKTAKNGTACASTADAAAVKAASMDASIEKRVCAESGKVSFVRAVNVNNKVTYQDVQYDANAGKFVNVAPSPATGTAKACPAGGAGCCANKAKAPTAVKTTTTAVKAAPASTTGG